MLSVRLREYADEKFNRRIKYYGPILDDIEENLKACTDEESVLMRFLYGTMPVRDAGEYDFSVFYSFVKHSLWLRENVEWCRELPEDVFIHHVLYYRINTEDISQCRSFFYDELKDRIVGMNQVDSVLEINYWCAEHVVYESTDTRTASPMTMLGCGRGRCGEESTFTVTAYRSVGIPARQVYTPRWAHCDDNHAWVEVYINGTWYFLGACEPEGVLNKGWFAAPASRAILIHSRNFCDFISTPDQECIGREELLVSYNNTSAYAKTAELAILVKDRTGMPVKDAFVALEILNMAEYFPAATLSSDEDGKVHITAGLGDIHVRAWKDSCWGEKVLSPQQETCIEIILERDSKEGQWITECWEEAELKAPEEYLMHPVCESKEIKELNAKRLEEANHIREQYFENCFPKEKAAIYPDEAPILKTAGENCKEILTFLEKDENPYRKRMLHSLVPKDYKDLKASVLEDHLSCRRGQWDEEVFVQYLLCPRIHLEEITPYRSYIRNYFTEKEKQEFCREPLKIWIYILNTIQYAPEADYKALCATPTGCLKLRHGNELSQKILFVAICRSLQIPARIDRVTLEPEYYQGNCFRPVTFAGGKNKRYGDREHDTAYLTIQPEDDTKWTYHQNWTIGRWEGVQFRTLGYEGATFTDNSLCLMPEPGIYRLLTTARMPDGSQHVSAFVMQLKESEKRQIKLNGWKNKTDEMLLNVRLEDFTLKDRQGHMNSLWELAEGKQVILAFLGVGAEPTEHVLNELLDCASQWNYLGMRMLMVLRHPNEMKNETLCKVLDKINGISVFFDQQGNSEKVAVSMKTDSEKLPLLTIVEEGSRGIYACSGYNVGSVELILSIIKSKRL